MVLVSAVGVLVACGGTSFETDEDASGGSAGSAGSTAGTGSGATSGSGAAGAGGSSAGSSAGGSAGSSSGGGGSGGDGGVGQGGSQSGGGGPGGSGGSVSEDCPGDVPTDGAECNYDGPACAYGDCCPTTASCDGGVWRIAVSSCPAPICPDYPPDDGSDCRCLGDLHCAYNECSGAGGVRAFASCDGSNWDVETAECTPEIIDCYGTGLGCVPGELCTKRDDPAAWAHECVLNPCREGEPLDCACAGRACPERFTCEYVRQFTESPPGHMWCRYTG